MIIKICCGTNIFGKTCSAINFLFYGKNGNSIVDWMRNPVAISITGPVSYCTCWELVYPLKVIKILYSVSQVYWFCIQKPKIIWPPRRMVTAEFFFFFFFDYLGFPCMTARLPNRALLNVFNYIFTLLECILAL